MSYVNHRVNKYIVEERKEVDTHEMVVALLVYTTTATAWIQYTCLYGAYGAAAFRYDQSRHGRVGLARRGHFTTIIYFQTCPYYSTLSHRCIIKRRLFLPVYYYRYYMSFQCLALPSLLYTFLQSKISVTSLTPINIRRYRGGHRTTLHNCTREIKKNKTYLVGDVRCRWELKDATRDSAVTCATCAKRGRWVKQRVGQKRRSRHHLRCSHCRFLPHHHLHCVERDRRKRRSSNADLRACCRRWQLAVHLVNYISPSRIRMGTNISYTCVIRNEMK